MYGLHLLMTEELCRLITGDLKMEKLKGGIQYGTLQMLPNKLEEVSKDNWEQLNKGFDREEPHPISENKVEYQDKERMVYCPNCRYEALTKLAGPKCSACRSWMIVVPKYSRLE